VKASFKKAVPLYLHCRLMLSSATKRFVLPFSEQKIRPPEVENAAIFAVAEFRRNKSNRLIARRSEEKLVYLSKIGYPLWIFPKNESTFVFDGFGDSYYRVPYAEIPSSKVFKENLDANLRPKEKYLDFLSNHNDYFNKPMKMKQFRLRGLIADRNFKKEFSIYRKEITEESEQAKTPLLLPSLEENTISSLVDEFYKLQSFLREEAETLPECIRLVSRTTSQYLTDLDYEAAAAKEEMDAKIRAQEEFVNPKIAKINKEYQRKIRDLKESFDKELQSHHKLKAKTQRFIEDNQEKIKLYQSEAKVRSAKKHVLYEKRWKEKIKQTQKELNGLKKELKNIKDNVARINKQKIQETSKLNFELDAEIKLTRQPLVDLKVSRDAKTLNFKQEKEKLLKQEKPVIDGLNKSLKLRKTTKANLENMNFGNQGLKSQTLFYVPFYVAYYETRSTKRYLIIPPSTISSVNFSAKLKWVFGMPKIKDLLDPRFKTIAALIKKVRALAKQNRVFAEQLNDLSQKNNLLNNGLFLGTVEAGLVYLEGEGWLSDKEHQDLSRCLKE
jgi:hypothetical protein